jgi:hypothetical protein
MVKSTKQKQVFVIKSMQACNSQQKIGSYIIISIFKLQLLNISWIFIAKKSSHKKECRIVKG